MNENRIRRFFPALTRAVMLPLAGVSLYIYREVLRMTADARLAMTLWHTVPRQMEHVLAGVAVYLGFSVLVSKLCATQRRQG